MSATVNLWTPSNARCGILIGSRSKTELMNGESHPRYNLENVIFPRLLDLIRYYAPDLRFLQDGERASLVGYVCGLVLSDNQLSREWIIEQFIPLYGELLQDGCETIRRSCTSVLGKFAARFGVCFTEKFVVPHLLALTQDANCFVRKVSCEVLVDVAPLCTPTTRRLTLAPYYLSFLNDSSRWVVQIGCQKLGQFIASFADAKSINPNLQTDHLNAQEIDRSENEKMNDEQYFMNFPKETILPKKIEYSYEIENTNFERNTINDLLNGWCCEEKKAQKDDDILAGLRMSCSESIAAVCSTHTDLTKLVSEDCDMSFVDEEMEDEVADDTNSNDTVEAVNTSSIAMDNDYIPQAVRNSFNHSLYWSFWEDSPIEMDLQNFDSKGAEKQLNMVDRLDKLYPHKEPRPFDNKYDNCEVDSNDGYSDSFKRFIQGRKSFFGLNGMKSIGNNDSFKNDSDVRSDCNDELYFNSQVPAALIEQYIKLVAISSGNDLSCYAHNFPAVAYTLGRQNWPRLKDSYMKLACDGQWRIRQCIAASIHDIATIIGEQNSDEHLVPIFELFLNDVDDVRICLVKHLSDFFKMIKPATRRKLIEVLTGFLHDDTRNWRFRIEYIRQCILLCNLHDINDINNFLAALALTLADDKIAEVRKEATIFLSCILGRFVREEWINDRKVSSCDESPIPITESFVNDIIKGFAKSQKWQRRQTFALFCKRCLETAQLNHDQFSSLLLEDLLFLSTDRVINVRISCADALAGTRGGRAFHGMRDSKTVKRTLEILTEDSDVDCRRAARLALGYLDVENLLDAKERGERLKELYALPLSQDDLTIRNLDGTITPLETSSLT